MHISLARSKWYFLVTYHKCSYEDEHVAYYKRVRIHKRGVTYRKALNRYPIRKSFDQNPVKKSPLYPLTRSFRKSRFNHRMWVSRDERTQWSAINGKLVVRKFRMRPSERFRDVQRRLLNATW
jgi:hypothetical protein